MDAHEYDNVKLLHKQVESLTKSGTWELDLQENQLKWSDGVFHILGYEAQEFQVTFERGVAVIHPEDRERATALMEEVLQNDKEYFIEKRLFTKSGNIIHVRSKANIFKDSKGIPVKLIGVFQDISDFVKSQDQIKEQNSLTQDILRNLPSAFFLFNQKGEHLLWNKQLEKITGYTHDEIAAKSPEDLYDGDEKEKVNQHIQKVLKNGYTELEAWISTKNNGKTPLFFTASTIQYKGERCIFGTGTDISLRLSLLHELQLLINNTEEAFMYLDSELNVISFNQQMKDHYELLFQKELKKGMRLSQLATSEQKLELNKIIKNVLTGNEAKAMLKVNREDKQKHYELKFRPILSDQKKLDGIFLTSSDITDRFEYEKAIKTTNERLELVMKASYESIWDYDALKDELYLGEGYRKKYGVDRVKADNYLDLHDALVHPEDFPQFKSSITSALEDPKIMEWEGQYRFMKNNGDYAHIQDRAIVLRDKNGKALRMVGAISDISKEYINDQLDKLEKQLMEQSISASESINKTLGNYLLGIEKLFKNINTSILSIEHNRLKNFITPSLPQGLVDAIEGLPIGLNQGSCGTAAYKKERVIVNDIQTDKRWDSYKDLAKQFDISACWSQPIFNSRGKVIATFAIYYKTPDAAQEFPASVFDRSANLISLILQNFNYVEKIQQSNERFAFINKVTNNAIYDWDVVNDSFYWGASLTRVFGHNIKNSIFTLKDWANWVHPEDLDEVMQNLDIFMANHEEVKWTYEYRFKDVNDQYAYVEEVGYLIRDKNGKPLRMIGALRDQTQTKRDEIQQELQRSISQLFKSGGSLNSALQSCLKYLTEFSNYSLGEIWLTNENHDCIRLASKYARTQSATDYSNFKLPKELQYGEGLPGKVWQESKIQKWDNIHKKAEFLNGEMASASGLTSAIAYPLYFGKKIMGIVLFAKDAEIKNDSYEISNFKILESFLGEEIKRKQQEEEQKLLFKSAPDILAVAKPNGYFTKVNPAFCNLLGYSSKELTSQHFMNFVHQEDIESTNGEFDEIKTGKKHAKNFTNRYKTKSGDYKWISWSSSYSFGPDNLVFSFGRDVTEMVELQQSVNTATKLARVGGWEINQLTGEHYWSPMTKEIHEVPEDFIPNLNGAINFYHPRYHQKVAAAVEKAEKYGESFDFEAIIITPKGKEKWVRAIGNVEMIEGKCVRIYGSFQDIHKRKTAELRLDNVSNNVPGVIFQYHLYPDGSDLLDFVSKGSNSIFGFEPEECMKSTRLIWDRIEAGGDMPQMKQSIIDSANSLSPWHAVWRYQHPDGKIYWHEGFGNPVEKSDGTILWDSIIVDISEKKIAEEQIKSANLALKKHARDLEISNAELEQFAYVASHDLQEPLRMISGFLTQLEKKYGDQLDEKAHQYIDFAVDGARRMRQIILDLLDFSRIGKLEEELTEVNLNEVVEEVCLLNRKRIEELNAKVQYKNLPTILEHSSPMIQLFQNLISNGLKYCNPEIPPKIIIRSKELKSKWKFTIKDNGIGIEEEHFDKIFNIFQRLHNKNEYSGTGMGLAIVKKIIENHNGKIWLESEKGKGTTFHFTLPKK